MTASVTLVEELATSLENAHHLHKSEIKTVTGTDLPGGLEEVLLDQPF